MGCQRKYFHKKIVKTPVDPDVTEDMESFAIGKTFHKVLENTKHVLDGYTYSDLLKVMEEYPLLTEAHAPMLYAMLGSYKRTHELSGLKAVACEVEVETDSFYGFVDVVLEGPGGKWYIGDMKTAASFSPAIIPTLFSHPQLNLYAAHKDEFAAAALVDPDLFAGCRYRLTTKSKLVPRNNEELSDFIGRLSGVCKTYDFIIPKERLTVDTIHSAHTEAYEYIEEHKHALDQKKFPKNYGNCMAYHRPCEFWSKCHERNYTSLFEVECIGGKDAK